MKTFEESKRVSSCKGFLGYRSQLLKPKKNAKS